MTAGIINKRKRIEQKIQDLHKQLETLQNECTHASVMKVNRADRGNYDPSCDRYWVEFKCPDCGKFWTEDL
jgi:predicted RNA-binding Zn-ribbon protein involved in translation (DUF1610 family)